MKTREDHAEKDQNDAENLLLVRMISFLFLREQKIGHAHDDQASNDRGNTKPLRKGQSPLQEENTVKNAQSERLTVLVGLFVYLNIAVNTITEPRSI